VPPTGMPRPHSLTKICGQFPSRPGPRDHTAQPRMAKYAKQLGFWSTYVERSVWASCRLVGTFLADNTALHLWPDQESKRTTSLLIG